MRCVLSLWEHVADAFDLGADGLEFFFDFFVAAIDMVDPVDNGFAVGDQGGEDQRGASAQVGGEDGGGAERSFTDYHGAAAFDFYVRAHADQFLRVHKAVLKNIFDDDGSAFGLRSSRHELRLHVGGEAGIFFGGEIAG